MEPLLDDDRLYFRQLLAGRDIARHDQIARQMVNFVYLVGDREAGEAVVVDPAYDVDGIIDVAAADGVTIVGAIGSHYHADHIGGSLFGHELPGVRDLLERIDVPVHVQADEVAWVQRTTDLTDAELTAHHGGDIVTVGKVAIELIHTPGHTPGSQCLLVADRLVSGDTLFLEGCGRTDLPGGDPAALYDSLTNRLAKVGDEVVLYPGHAYAPEPSMSMGDTRRFNMVFGPRNAQEWLATFGR